MHKLHFEDQIHLSIRYPILLVHCTACGISIPAAAYSTATTGSTAICVTKAVSSAINDRKPDSHAYED
jgi:hypothetical protein